MEFVYSVGGTFLTEVTYQGSDYTTVRCTFSDGLSHYCLLCCSTDQSQQGYAYSNISGFIGSVVTVGLYGMKAGAVYYCKPSAVGDGTVGCPMTGGLFL